MILSQEELRNLCSKETLNTTLKMNNHYCSFLQKEKVLVFTIYKIYSDTALELNIEGQIQFLNLLGETFSEHLLNIFKQHRYKN